MVNFSKEEVEVVVVGAGPSDCFAYLWKEKSYDRLHLHLSKDFCSLPFMPYVTSSPKYLPKNEFIQYLDEYVEYFNITQKFQTFVELAFYNHEEKKWNIKSRNVTSGEMELYACDFLILATRENNEGSKVLVVGSGNSGMEISFDLSNYESHTSIVVRSPLSLFISLYLVFTLSFFIFMRINVVAKEMVHVGMVVLKYLPISLVDINLEYHNQKKVHFLFSKGTSPVIDVCAIDKIKLGEIKEHTFVFENGEEQQFDAIIFATGYKNVATKWLMNPFPNHWKGENGLYCVGFSKRGLAGISMDAINIIDDIKTIK
ncbi:hypothetical protein H5410_036835 [Solanum commersonii]|uniref:Flavin-containing monooxygenase n=1 Tax=Solanum commersonii TaxID=4109 RepID=A0A9J5Y4L3_SOLCO|nr:hypothetical protein H5410_036835 [Solanum commersonii]